MWKSLAYTLKELFLRLNLEYCVQLWALQGKKDILDTGAGPTRALRRAVRQLYGYIIRLDWIC